ncbi:MAG: transglycosylase domain-containing protein [Deltaproteobacteria bacterium]|nr:transglycosylase domain-containing protein [Deltaproteobacteria bacterium]
MGKKIKKPRSKIFKIFKGFLIVCVVLFLGVFATGTIVYFNAAKDLPKLDNMEDYRPPIMAEVYADNGQKVGEFWEQARILTPIDKIPKKLIEAFVASEDDRFFDHGGVDVYSIIRAFWRNFQAGHVVEGGSTITQQLTKGLLLTPERSYDRKIKEAILATRIEKNLSKDQILYLYLNQIYFGNRAYGVAAAARNYFHKDLQDLDLAEISMIVGLSKGPGRYNPIVNPQRAISRQHYVLDRMAEEGYISKKEAESAKKAQLKIYNAGIDKDFNNKFAPYFVEHVRRYIKQKYGDEALYKGGWQVYTTLDLDMYRAAQEAVSTNLMQLDRRYGYRGPSGHLNNQQEIEKFLHLQHMKLLDTEDQLNYFGFKGEEDTFKQVKTPLQAGKLYEAVVANVSSSGLQIQIGNINGTVANSNMDMGRSSHFTPGDIVQVKLKTASAAPTKGKGKNKAPISEAAPLPVVSNSSSFVLSQKPEIQAALYSYEPFSGKLRAMIGGFSFEDSEFDRSTQALRQPGSSIKPIIYAAALDKGYTPATVIMDSPIHYPDGSGKMWEPKNYGGNYFGPTLFRNALVNSRNVVTVRILMDIGTHYVAGYMRKLGITSPIFKFYSMALGATEVYLEQLCRAYGTFPTGGVLPDVYFIKKIIGPNGQVIEEHIENPNKFIVTWGNVKSENKEEKKLEPESKPSNNSVTIKHKRSYEEMSFNPDLLTQGETATKRDDLQLTEYERKVLYGDYIPPQHSVSPQTAVTMTSILKDVVRYGTGTRAQAIGRPAGGKTGTTNGATDAWFIGFTPNLLTGVWVGFDKKIKSIGHGATGGTIAAPIWVNYMLKVVAKYPNEDFIVPKGIDLSKYQTPIQVVGIGDAELGDIGIGTGVDNTKSYSNSSASFFSQDLDN